MKADTQKLIRSGNKLVSILDWGLVNPDTGMIRAQCDDSVAEGRYYRLRARVRASSAPRETHLCAVLTGPLLWTQLRVA